MTDPAARAPLNVLVVDDHAIVREGVVRILQGAWPDGGVTEAGNGGEALEHLRTGRFDLAIVDVSMPGMNGLDLVRRLRAEAPGLGILVFSMHAEEQYALRALRCGANGYLTKDRAGAELLAAVRKVAAGGLYVTESLAERVVLGLRGGHAPTAPDAALSDRELDVLRRIVEGGRIGDIADALHLSVKTVSTHKRRIMDKLGLASTAALIRWGMEHGLVAPATGADAAAAPPAPS